jgi:L-galactose dehydrogenase/L-glyceraldehyde 3-phosphate reductase
MIEQRRLGRTGLMVSALGFGCGAVGGLMVRGTAPDQLRAVGTALDAGITYFDTAADYGAGASETNLGRALQALKAAPVVGTKVRIRPEQKADMASAILASMDASLARLGMAQVHLFQLHNPITLVETPTTLTPAQVASQVLPAFEKLRLAGKALWFGFTAIGDDSALRQVIDAGGLASAQAPFNLLNGAPGSVQSSLLEHAAAADIGTIGIRILAGGALSGAEARGPLGTPNVAPIASGESYAADVAAARRLLPLIHAGHAETLVEAAIRFAMGAPAMHTALIGLGSQEELDLALRAARRGALTHAALAEAAALQPPR